MSSALLSFVATIQRSPPTASGRSHDSLLHSIVWAISRYPGSATIHNKTKTSCKLAFWRLGPPVKVSKMRWQVWWQGVLLLREGRSPENGLPYERQDVRHLWQVWPLESDVREWPRLWRLCPFVPRAVCLVPDPPHQLFTTYWRILVLGGPFFCGVWLIEWVAEFSQNFEGHLGIP